jgi:hypothetical protein
MDQNEALRHGEPVIVGDAIYQKCAACGSIVKLTGIMGGWHICAERPVVNQKEAP